MSTAEVAKPMDPTSDWDLFFVDSQGERWQVNKHPLEINQVSDSMEHIPVNVERIEVLPHNVHLEDKTEESEETEAAGEVDGTDGLEACIRIALPPAVRGQLHTMAREIQAWQDAREEDEEAADEDADQLPQPTIRVWDASETRLCEQPLEWCNGHWRLGRLSARKLEPDEKTAVELLAGYGGSLIHLLDAKEHSVGFSDNQPVQRPVKQPVAGEDAKLRSARPAAIVDSDEASRHLRADNCWRDDGYMILDGQEQAQGELRERVAGELLERIARLPECSGYAKAPKDYVLSRVAQAIEAYKYHSHELLLHAEFEEDHDDIDAALGLEWRGDR